MPHFFQILTALFLLVGCASSGTSDAKRAELHLKIGTAYLAQGQYPAAMSELRRAEHYDKSNAVIQNNLGLAYLVRGRIKEAEVHIRRALELSPQYTDARNNLGRVLIEKSMYESAIKELKIAAEDLTYSEPHRPLSNLGFAYFLNGDFKTAKATLKEALKFHRQDCFSLTAFGRTLLELKEFDGAVESLDQASRVCSKEKQEECLYYSAVGHLKLGQPKQAKARLDSSIENFPNGTFSKKVKGLLKKIR